MWHCKSAEVETCYQLAVTTGNNSSIVQKPFDFLHCSPGHFQDICCGYPSTWKEDKWQAADQHYLLVRLVNRTDWVWAPFFSMACSGDWACTVESFTFQACKFWGHSLPVDEWASFVAHCGDQQMQLVFCTPPCTHCSAVLAMWPNWMLVCWRNAPPCVTSTWVREKKCCVQFCQHKKKYYWAQ